MRPSWVYCAKLLLGSKEILEEITNRSEERNDCCPDCLEEAKLFSRLIGSGLLGSGLLGSNVVGILCATSALAFLKLMLVRRNVVRIGLAALALALYEVMLVRSGNLGLSDSKVVLALIFKINEANEVQTGLKINLAVVIKYVPACATRCPDVSILCGYRSGVYEYGKVLVASEGVTTCLSYGEVGELIRMSVLALAVCYKVILVTYKLVLACYNVVSNEVGVGSVADCTDVVVIVVTCCRKLNAHSVSNLSEILVGPSRTANLTVPVLNVTHGLTTGSNSVYVLNGVSCLSVGELTTLHAVLVAREHILVLASGLCTYGRNLYLVDVAAVAKRSDVICTCFCNSKSINVRCALHTLFGCSKLFSLTVYKLNNTAEKVNIIIARKISIS